MFLARKITRAKWETRTGVREGEIGADAVTADLRTQDNKLFFWKCGSASTEEVEEAALALAAGRDQLDKMELVWVAEDDLVEDGLDLFSSRGQTPVGTWLNDMLTCSSLTTIDWGRLLSECRPLWAKNVIGD